MWYFYDIHEHFSSNVQFSKILLLWILLYSNYDIFNWYCTYVMVFFHVTLSTQEPCSTWRWNHMPHSCQGRRQQHMVCIHTPDHAAVSMILQTVCKCELSVLLLEGKCTVKRQLYTLKEAVSFFFQHECSASLPVFCTQLHQTHTPTFALQKWGQGHALWWIPNQVQNSVNQCLSLSKWRQPVCMTSLWKRSSKQRRALCMFAEILLHMIMWCPLCCNAYGISSGGFV